MAMVTARSITLPSRPPCRRKDTITHWAAGALDPLTVSLIISIGTTLNRRQDILISSAQRDCTSVPAPTSSPHFPVSPHHSNNGATARRAARCVHRCIFCAACWLFWGLSASSMFSSPALSNLTADQLCFSHKFRGPPRLRGRLFWRMTGDCCYVVTAVGTRKTK
ncbi:hypothetical protein K402DRAFT_115239 [Aulographum hederae CBS 113979]|uniref:Uncharacterized protein n=1 Tax=Aulographum hederae CBS 113979 TaxID=1176131 RepID=A0A6G1GWI8_9PEZI|nr:hypothetical protein K402DRAFT_115239 [Aulographum hederae CBS 113979]